MRMRSCKNKYKMATGFVVRPIFRRLVTNLNGSRKYLAKTTVKTRIAVATTCSAATVLGWYGIKKHLNNTSLLTVEAKDVNSQVSQRPKLSSPISITLIDSLIAVIYF